MPVTESPTLHSSREASGRALTASPAAGALLWPSSLPCQTLALHLSPDALALLPNPPGSGILQRKEREAGEGAESELFSSSNS